MAQLDIYGPQAKYEKSGRDLLRDTRPWHRRLGDVLGNGNVCACILTGCGALMAGVPGTVEFIWPTAVIYAGCLMGSRVRLPMRIPMKAQLRDPSDRDERGRMRIGSGADYLGHELGTKRQVWHGLEDIPTHVAVPGTTGSGKTRALLSIAVVNAIAQGSGVLYVDGKGQTELYAEIMAIARKYGREDDVYVLNFLTASGQDSFTLAPFATARANMIKEILVGQLPEPGGEGNSRMFSGRLVGFLGTIAPILEWLRVERGIPTTLERVRDLTELSNVVRIATDRTVKLTDGKLGTTQLIDLHDLPNEFVQGLRDYLGQTGGFDLDTPLKQQKTTQPSEQHSFITMQLTEVFSSWLITLGHIFRTHTGDIDMKDVVLNRRILVVILPVLEGSEQTTAGLGRIVVSMLRSVMAHSLGARIEGDYDEIIANQPTASLASFRVVFDELVYYATSGMDAMLAMARGLRMQFLMGFQEAAGMKARIGDKLYSLLGNASLQVIMRLQEGGETRNYVEKTAGTMHVTQSGSYESTSEFTNGTISSPNAEVREVNRVNWNDVRKLKPGEAILVFGRSLVHARIFRTQVDLPGLVRRNRPCVLSPPQLEDLVRHRSKIAVARKALLNGAGAADAPESPLSPALKLLLSNYARELGNGIPAADAGHRAARSLPPDTPISLHQTVTLEQGTKTEPDHAFSEMLRAVSDTETETDSGLTAIQPDTKLAFRADSDLLKQITQIEREGAGLTVPAAKAAAKETLALHASAVQPPNPIRLPAVPPEHLCSLINSLSAAIEAHHSQPAS